jgi:hypothetical protein
MIFESARVSGIDRTTEGRAVVAAAFFLICGLGAGWGGAMVPHQKPHQGTVV